MELVDIGANLTHESFHRDLPAVLDRATMHGVHTLVVTGADAAGSAAALALAQAYPGRLWATAGVHPHQAASYTDATERHLRELLADPQVKAVGECGLDYNRNFSPQPAQRASFARQLAIAADVGKPLFLHQRDAHADFIAALDAAAAPLPRAVVHCFTGTGDELDDYLARGFFIGVTGWICDERRGHHLRDLVGRIPTDRLMLETDAPYLLPRDLPAPPRDRRNEPMYLEHVCRAVAAARGEPPEVTAAHATQTTRAFFDL